MNKVIAGSEPFRPQSNLTIKIILEDSGSYSQTFITPENEPEQIRLRQRIERFLRDCITEFGLEQTGIR